jgi:poly-gamma-glutamate synthesis protein (capsule biosynthesis protein)
MPDGTIKEALVVYSLGNFISNQQQPNTDGGILFQVDLLKNRNTPTVQVGNHGIIPVWRYIEKTAGGKTNFYAVPVARAELFREPTPNMTTMARNNMLNFAKGLRKRMPFNELKI